jgi:hypothetical protein
MPMGSLATEGQGRKHANASAPAATPQAALPRLPCNNHKPIMLPTIMLARRPKIQIAIVLMARAWAFPSNHCCGVNADHRGLAAGRLAVRLPNELKRSRHPEMQRQPAARINICHEVLAVTPGRNELGALEAGSKCPYRELAKDPRTLTTT